MNIQEPFTVTTTQIQDTIAKMTTKAEILLYLSTVKDFIGSTMKITRVMLKGMK